jgi:hypothetical protein
MEKLPALIAGMGCLIFVFYGAIIGSVIFAGYKILQHFGIL